MAVVKRLLVKTATTHDGLTVDADNEGFKRIKETILPVTAERDLLAENNKRPNWAKHKIEYVYWDTVKRKIVDPNEKKAAAGPKKPAGGGKAAAGPKKPAAKIEDPLGDD